MPAELNSKARRIASRVRRTWAQIDSAERRIFELPTGIAAQPAAPRQAPRGEVEWLEALYALPAEGCGEESLPDAA